MVLGGGNKKLEVWFQKWHREKGRKDKERENKWEKDQRKVESKNKLKKRAIFLVIKRNRMWILI